jgi:hypothetical protein
MAFSKKRNGRTSSRMPFNTQPWNREKLIYMGWTMGLQRDENSTNDGSI